MLAFGITATPQILKPVAAEVVGAVPSNHQAHSPNYWGNATNVDERTGYNCKKINDSITAVDSEGIQAVHADAAAAKFESAVCVNVVGAVATIQWGYGQIL